MMKDINAPKKSSINTHLYEKQYKHQLNAMQASLSGADLSDTLIILDGALLYFDSQDRHIINHDESVLRIKELTGLSRSAQVVAIESFGGLYLQDIDGAIFKAHPETAEIASFWGDGKRWVNSLSNHQSEEVKKQTGWPIWLQAKEIHGWLSPECRIVPELPISLGGNFSVKNMSPRLWQDAYSHYVGVRQALQDLPSGAMVQWPLTKQ